MQTRVVDRPELYLIGKSYYGISTSDEVHEVIRGVHTQVLEGKLQGELMVCYFGNPDQDDDSVKVFAGVATLVKQAAMPEGMERLEFPAKRVVQAEINAYSFVAPNPDEVNAKLYELADSQNMKLDSVYVERYASPQQIFNEIYEQ